MLEWSRSICQSESSHTLCLCLNLPICLTDDSTNTLSQLNLVCGTSNALVSVIEPEKCEYLFTVTSPAVCFPPSQTQAQGDEQELEVENRRKDEL